MGPSASATVDPFNAMSLAKIAPYRQSVLDFLAEVLVEECALPVWLGSA